MSTTVATALASPSLGVWSRLLQQLSPRPPRLNRCLPKIKEGRVMLELEQPGEWRAVDVVLAGSSLDDLGLYYFADRQQPPLGWIPLQTAHIDTLEEVVMVITADRTWFLCADQARDADDWASEICSAIDRVADSEVGASSITGADASSPSPRSQQSRGRQRLSSGATAATLRELQSRDAKTRADEFLELLVRCSASGARELALKGALSWSCVRSVVWKVWLDYIPGDLPLRQWLPAVRDKRQHYASERSRLSVLRDNLSGLATDEEFIDSCEVSQDALLYDIYKDVRRTRGHMDFFRGPKVQAIMVRVLYTYSKTHPAVSYNQGMSELLATVVYLLHVEQWPSGSEAPPSAERVDKQPEKAERDEEAGGTYGFFSFARRQSAPRVRSPSSERRQGEEQQDESYVHVRPFLDAQSDGKDDGAAALDRDALLQLPAFAGACGKYDESCRRAAEDMARELTLGCCIEHDAYGLLEELMLRMAGTFCPDAVVVPLDLAAANALASKRPHTAQRRGRRRRRGSPSGMARSAHSAELATSPLYEQMNRIHEHILRRCDPPTARALAHLGVEPHMFLLRWVRVLMAREFELAHVWRVWDAIFALTPSDFSFINLLCAAVVRAFRAEIERAEDATSVLLALRDVADRIDAEQLIASARELYDALLIAAAAEADASAVTSPATAD